MLFAGGAGGFLEDDGGEKAGDEEAETIINAGVGEERSFHESIMLYSELVII